MTNPARQLLAAACLAALSTFAGPAAAQSLSASPQPGVVADQTLNLENLPVQAYQADLLGQAFAAASAFPVNPHIKNRSRAQERVALAAIELGQFGMADDYAQQIQNWRRGMVYAALAEALLERGEADAAAPLLDRALAYGVDEDQGWRNEQVRSRVAYVRTLMGQPERAADVVEGLEGPRARRGLVEAQARIAEEAEFDAVLETLGRMVSTQDYEAIKSALGAYAELYDRFYTDPARRSAVDRAMRAAWEPMPALTRLEILFRCIDTAAAHDDLPHGLDLVDEAERVKDAHAWSADFGLPLTAELAKRRSRLGDVPGARRVLAGALAGADAGLDTLQNFQRADALRPLAEAYAGLGDRERAAALYERVVALGAVNPNIRPRVTDIVSNCVSMALHEIEPTESLQHQVTAIVSSLGQP